MIVDAEALFNRYREKGPNPEYKAFERRIGPSTSLGNASGIRRRAVDVWRFIEDAVTGAGGFSDGSYLFPFKAEIENSTVTQKLLRRSVEADYDRFAEHVCNAPWDLIVSASDMIERKSEDSALSEFWANVDNHGTSMLDFLEYPFAQARKYGTGWVILDRPAVAMRNQAENHSPATRPYAYAVPTRCVVDWEFDDDGVLIGLVILEPGHDYQEGDDCPVRVWTRKEWQVWEKSGEAWGVTDTGVNSLGIIPVVPIFNDQPPPCHALGQSEMLEVARLAQTVYNIDSECREIERKCALFLAIPVKNAGEYAGGQVTVGLENAIVYDGEAGEPRWVSPDLTILQRLDERRKSKKDAAYEMAHLRALNGGVVQTASGFHAEVEFQKTERRVARHAAMLERVEKDLASLFLRFYGHTESDFSITYPRDFGVRDMQRLLDDVERVLKLNLGESTDRAEISKLLRARYPRKAEEEIASMVDEAIASRSTAARQVSAVERVKMAMAGPPQL